MLQQQTPPRHVRYDQPVLTAAGPCELAWCLSATRARRAAASTQAGPLYIASGCSPSVGQLAKAGQPADTCQPRGERQLRRAKPPAGQPTSQRRARLQDQPFWFTAGRHPQQRGTRPWPRRDSPPFSWPAVAANRRQAAASQPGAELAARSRSWPREPGSADRGRAGQRGVKPTLPTLPEAPGGRWPLVAAGGAPGAQPRPPAWPMHAPLAWRPAPATRWLACSAGDPGPGRGQGAHPLAGSAPRARP